MKITPLLLVKRLQYFLFIVYILLFSGMAMYVYLNQDNLAITYEGKEIEFIPPPLTKKCEINEYAWIQVSEDTDCEQALAVFLAESEATVSADSIVEVVPSSTPQLQIITRPPIDYEQLWRVEQVDEITTIAGMPPDDRMATADELFEAVNNYRDSHKLPHVQKHETLCSIAQTRADQLKEMGQLDDHEGFKPLAQDQNEFYTLSEIIQGGGQPNYAVHLVEWGWGRSLTGHKEALLNRDWNYGCGGISGYFSVFVFGRK